MQGTELRVDPVDPRENPKTRSARHLTVRVERAADARLPIFACCLRVVEERQDRIVVRPTQTFDLVADVFSAVASIRAWFERGDVERIASCLFVAHYIGD